MKQISWTTENAKRGTFNTIDYVIRLSQDLCERLCKIGEYKYLFAVRRGVSSMVDKEDSKTVRAGAITYFFDLKETKDNKPFLVITESRFKGEGEDHERKSILVFQDNIQEFSQALSEIAAKME